MSEAKSYDIDEIDELLIAEGVMTEKEVLEAKKRAEEWNIEELIETAEPIPEDGSSASNSTEKSGE